MNLGYISRMSNKMLLLFVALLFTTGLASKADVLQAGVEHSESLPPVHPMLRAGSSFDESYLPKAETDSQWFRIPRWMAGTWKRIQSNRLDPMQGLVTEKDIRVKRYGFQTDGKKGVWHWVRTPFPAVTESDYEYHYFLVQRELPVAITKDQAVIRLIWTSWSYNKVTRLITNVNQGIQYDTITPKSYYEIEVRSLLKFFNPDGRYMDTQRRSWIDYRTEAYQPIDEYKGVALKGMFYAYLEKSGNTDRLPHDQTSEYDTARANSQE